MALDAGELILVLEFAQDLKDVEYIGKQDPFVILTCGPQTYRSRTIQGGGKNPVWNETFRFNLINENDIMVTVKDADVTTTTLIGSGRLNLAKARSYGTDRQQVSLTTKRGIQKGIVSFSMTFTRNSMLGHPAQAYAQPYAQPYAPQPQYPYPPPAIPAPYPAAPVPYTPPPAYGYPAASAPAYYPPHQPVAALPPPPAHYFGGAAPVAHAGTAPAALQTVNHYHYAAGAAPPAPYSAPAPYSTPPAVHQQYQQYQQPQQVCHACHAPAGLLAAVPPMYSPYQLGRVL